MLCPKCETRMGCNQTKNYTDPYKKYYYVERRRICPNCEHRLFTVELTQDDFMEMIKEEYQDAR